jgi:hypothetical protein
MASFLDKRVSLTRTRGAIEHYFFAWVELGTPRFFCAFISDEQHCLRRLTCAGIISTLSAGAFTSLAADRVAPCVWLAACSFRTRTDWSSCVLPLLSATSTPPVCYKDQQKHSYAIFSFFQLLGVLFFKCNFKSWLRVLIAVKILNGLNRIGLSALQ